MSNERLYTQNDLDIELLKQRNNDTYDRFGHIYKTLDKIESQQKWLLGLMGTGFISLLGLMAHGFNWVKW